MKLAEDPLERALRQIWESVAFKGLPPELWEEEYEIVEQYVIGQREPIHYVVPRHGAFIVPENVTIQVLGEQDDENRDNNRREVRQVQVAERTSAAGRAGRFLRSILGRRHGRTRLSSTGWDEAPTSDSDN